MYVIENKVSISVHLLINNYRGTFYIQDDVMVSFTYGQKTALPKVPASAFVKKLAT